MTGRTSLLENPSRFWMLFLVLFLVDAFSQAWGQETGPIIEPAMFGFDLPRGEVRWADREVNALVPSDRGQVVGRVHVKVGDNFIVLMPDGRLVAKPGTEVEFTEKPVEWATPEQLIEKLRVGPLAKFNVLKRRNHVFIYNTTEKMAQVTMSVMESMTRGLVKYMNSLGIKSHNPEIPLVIIMFQTETQFQAYRRMPPGVVAYYDAITNRVFLYEESPLLKVDRDLAIRETLSTIAHEGAHQILANTGVQQRLSGWPLWLSEGLAEYLAPTSVNRNMGWKGAGQINDFRMLELETFLRTKALDGIDGSTLKNTVAAARLTSTGYASAWSLTNYLAKRQKDEFRDCLQEVSRLRPFEGSFPSSPRQRRIAENVVQFEKHFGKEWEETETEMIKFLSRQKFRSPFAAFAHFAVLIEIPAERKPDKYSAVFHSEQLAVQWANELVKKRQSEGKPTIRIVRCPNREQAIRQTKIFYGQRR